jgi:hypothetical protein
MKLMNAHATQVPRVTDSTRDMRIAQMKKRNPNIALDLSAPTKRDGIDRVDLHIHDEPEKRGNYIDEVDIHNYSLADKMAAGVVYEEDHNDVEKKVEPEAPITPSLGSSWTPGATTRRYELSELRDLVTKVVDAENTSDVIRQYPNREQLGFKMAYRKFLDLIGL